MIEVPMDVLKQFPIRKNKKQKQQFRDAVQSYLKTIGYESVIEQGAMGARNIVIGNPETAKYLVTAHYDTPAALPFSNLITPCNFLPFLGYQIVITLLIFLAAFVPCLILAYAGMSAEIASRIYGISLYALLVLMLVGPANKNNANDNTSGVVTVLEITKSMPQPYREQVCFVLFDLEEAGLIGSASYQKAHKKQTSSQIVLNMDCVGDGNELMMFPTKKMLKDAEKMEQLRRITGTWGEKSIALREKGFAYYPSDQKHFRYGVGIAAFNRSKWAGLYCSRIHTKKDTVLEETNVNILRAAVVSLITCGAVK
ncbi:MAG: M28 family peptidase [Oscillospiraceae bacterium]|nr:M28 family peptidase [Oscillospiraceae bacterium]